MSTARGHQIFESTDKNIIGVERAEYVVYLLSGPLKILQGRTL